MTIAQGDRIVCRLRTTVAILIGLALSALLATTALISVSLVAPDQIGQPVYAQAKAPGTPSPTPVASPSITATRAMTVQPTVGVALLATALVTPTAGISTTTSPSPTATPTNGPETSTPTATFAPTSTPLPTATPTPSIEDSAMISGTIIANRTAVTVTFFLEGRFTTIKRLRSLGINLARSATVLTLYNCESTAPSPQSQPDCFWDPYLVRRDGFYEVFNGAAAGRPVQLILQEAGPPPTNQVWVHNRTGRAERIFYEGQAQELPPGVVQEIAIKPDGEPAFSLSSCVILGKDSACEWLPEKIKGGVYYALVEVSTPGGLPDSYTKAAKLQPILTQARDTTTVAAAPPPVELAPAAAPVAVVAPKPALAAGQMTCRLQVPTLNVRSGPGLKYMVLSNLQMPAKGGRAVTVVGRDETGEWLALDSQIAAGGWIIGSDRFVVCDGDMTSLPVAQVVDGRMEVPPTPGPQIAAPAPAAAPTSAAPQPTAEPTRPSNKAVLIVNNAYDDDITFTISPIVEEKIKPKASYRAELPPGRVTFTVGTPRGYSGNADLTLNAGDERQLWVRFEPESPGAEVFVLKY